MKQGDTIGCYELLRLLGEGGMGQVWLVEDSIRNRQVALKILSPTLSSDNDVVQRFLLEGQNLLALNHKNIISALDAGQDQGDFYLAMEIVQGKETEEIVEKHGPMDEDTVLAMAHQLAGALAYAWREHAILHRDIKPSNIMIHANRHPYLMDFGIAKVMTDDIHLTLTGFSVGTPYYMSPEQATAQKDLDCRSDIYSLGATLFHLLTGRVPHPGDTPMAVISGLLKGPAPSVRDMNPAISPACAAILAKMLAKDRKNRYQNWESVKMDLGRVLKHKPLSGEEGNDSPREEVTSKSASTKIIATIAVIVILAAIVLGGVYGARRGIFRDLLPSSVSQEDMT
ncbi:hypothetical protein BVX99_00830 [bacterium F16]|nr:hypothetical protein BVX99_00830 [bacterium F16]